MQNTKTGESWIELAHVVINGQGFLNRPKYPDDVPGFETFKGKVLHTARWDNTYSCVGKEVALIGTGSSGLQVAGAIGPFTKKLVIFMRTPCWTMPFFQNLILTPEERENFKDRKFFFDYYKKSWETAERFFQVYFDGSAMQKRVMAMVR